MQFSVATRNLEYISRNVDAIGFESSDQPVVTLTNYLASKMPTDQNKASESPVTPKTASRRKRRAKAINAGAAVQEKIVKLSQQIEAVEGAGADQVRPIFCKTRSRLW